MSPRRTSPTPRHRTARRPTPLLAIGLLAIACLVMLAPGCVSTGAGDAPPTMEVTLRPDGRLDVYGRIVDLAHLPKRLRAEGATQGSEIRIAIDPTTTRIRMGEVFGTLHGAGYRKILFLAPQSAEANTPSSRKDGSP